MEDRGHPRLSFELTGPVISLTLKVEPFMQTKSS